MKGEAALKKTDAVGRREPLEAMGTEPVALLKRDLETPLPSPLPEPGDKG